MTQMAIIKSQELENDRLRFDADFTTHLAVEKEGRNMQQIIMLQMSGTNTIF